MFYSICPYKFNQKPYKSSNTEQNSSRESKLENQNVLWFHRRRSLENDLQLKLIYIIVFQDAFPIRQMNKVFERKPLQTQQKWDSEKIYSLSNTGKNISPVD